MELDLTGKNAIVTGAGSGIGKAIAGQLADCGANVWICDINEENCRTTLGVLKEFKGTTGYTKVDVASFDEVEKLFEEAKGAYGEINIVVNAAGVFGKDHFIEATPEQIKKHLDINLMGQIYGCQLALKTMIEQGKGGKIVNISSVGGRHGELDFPWYALGKAGILNMTQSAAYNGAPHGINVNAVCPGIIRTPMWDVILRELKGGSEDIDTESLFQEILKARTPLGRAQTPEEIAYTVTFLCSEFADVITGQAINVCGGSVMS